MEAKSKPDVEDVKALVLRLVRLGLTDDELHKVLGFKSRVSMRGWFEREGLWEAIDEERAFPNHAVQQALIKRALGYKTREVKKEMGRPVSVTVKEVSPSDTAIIFYLKNRMAELWSDRINVGITLRDRASRAENYALESRQSLNESPVERQKGHQKRLAVVRDDDQFDD